MKRGANGNNYGQAPNLLTRSHCQSEAEMLKSAPRPEIGTSPTAARPFLVGNRALRAPDTTNIMLNPPPNNDSGRTKKALLYNPLMNPVCAPPIPETDPAPIVSN
jgi:hypothetical protein